MSEIKSVEKAMLLLNALAASDSGLSLQELSVRCGYPKTTVYGLLSTMRHFGVIEQDGGSGKYRLGMHLFELGNAVRRSWHIVDYARTYMPGIAMQTGETVGLWTYQAEEMLCLYLQDTGNPMRVVTEAGSRFPMHSTAMGKAVWAFMPDRHQCRQLLKNKTRRMYTPHTLVEAQDLEREFERVRYNGVAVENGEHRIGLRCVGAPVFNSSGFPQYVLVSSGMFRSIKEERFLLAARLIWEACARLSVNMGYTGQYPAYRLEESLRADHII